MKKHGAHILLALLVIAALAWYFSRNAGQRIAGNTPAWTPPKSVAPLSQTDAGAAMTAGAGGKFSTDRAT